MRLVIIGGGNMGGAILLALLKSSSIPSEDILLIESDGEKRKNINNVSACILKLRLTRLYEATRWFC